MTTLATDDFNRADAADLGANWTNKRNSPGIVSNQVDVTATGDENIAYYDAVTWPDDQWSQVTTLVAGAATRAAAAGVRLQDTVRSGYYGGFDQNNFGDSVWRLWKWVGGTLTGLAASGTSASASDVFYVEIQGTTLKLFVNTVEQLSASPADYASGHAGIYLVNGATDVAILDNFSAGDFTSAVTGPPAGRRLISHTW